MNHATEIRPRYGAPRQGAPLTAKDPILFGGGDTNLYVYAGNDPVNRIDPWGLQSLGTNGEGICGGVCGDIDFTPEQEETSSCEGPGAGNPGRYGMPDIPGLCFQFDWNGYFAEHPERIWAGVGPIAGPGGRAITIAEGYVMAEGSLIRFSEYYYEKLWVTGRGAPFLQAEEVLRTATTITCDRMPGFFRYTNGVMEMVYNPTTREVWHLLPLP